MTVIADQVCSVPFRIGKNQLEYCIISTRSGQWTFPKGNIESGEHPAAASFREAFEEAGVTGHLIAWPNESADLGGLQPGAVDRYCYEKAQRVRNVLVYVMQVHQSQSTWPDSDWRERHWVAADQVSSRLHVKPLIDCFTRIHEQLVPQYREDVAKRRR